MEKRYGIMEKEMLAVVQRINKFEYELIDKNLYFIKDHKTLEFIKTRGVFEKSRVN